MNYKTELHTNNNDYLIAEEDNSSEDNDTILTNNNLKGSFSFANSANDLDSLNTPAKT